MKKKNIHAMMLGRLSRGKTSPAKKVASRKNGMLGGRPRKVVDK